MKVRFKCVLHDENLEGDPIWFRNEDGTFSPDTSEMNCPRYHEGWTDEQVQACNNSWDGIVVELP